MGYKITLNRRLSDGSRQTVVYKLTEIASENLTEEEKQVILFDTEVQANGERLNTLTHRDSVRVWIDQHHD